MAERANRLPTAKNWADDIDDLYHDATERNLRAIFWNRPRALALDAEKADDRPRRAGSVQRGAALPQHGQSIRWPITPVKIA